MAQRVIGYVRVSTDKQADKGVSLEAQRAKIESYAELYDLEIVEMVVDAGLSAKTLDREGLQRALAMLRAGQADAIVVLKLDRLTRSVVDLGTLVADYFGSGKHALLSVSEQIDTRSAAGRLVLNVLASVSAWEREAIGERTSTALRHMASQGEFTGGQAPYGFNVAPDGEHLASVEAEQRVIARVAELAARGYSLRSISAALASEGAFNRRGNAFAPDQISRMLRTKAGGGSCQHAS